MRRMLKNPVLKLNLALPRGLAGSVVARTISVSRSTSRALSSTSSSLTAVRTGTRNLPTLIKELRSIRGTPRASAHSVNQIAIRDFYSKGTNGERMIFETEREL